jgi:hypothetical protein
MTAATRGCTAAGMVATTGPPTLAPAELTPSELPTTFAPCE